MAKELKNTKSTKNVSNKKTINKRVTKPSSKNSLLSKKNDDFGIASLILGVISILPFFGLNLVAGVLGIIFGYKQKNISDSKTAKVGIILSIIGLVLWFVIYVIAIFALASFLSLVAYAST
jgi:hypothetical protein